MSFWSDVWDVVTAPIDAVVDAVADAVDFVVDKVGDGFEAAFNAFGLPFFGDAAEWLVRRVGGQIDWTIRSVSTYADTIGQSVDDLIDERLWRDFGSWLGTNLANFATLTNSWQYENLIRTLAIGTRSLSDQEKAYARSIFGDSINLDAVRIDEYSLAGAPSGRPFTTFHTINSWGKFDFNDVNDRAVLMHELTHVWQFEHMGGRYIPDALAHNDLADYDYGGVAGLTAALAAGKGLLDFNVEQQAKIVEDYARIRDDGNLQNDVNLPLYATFVQTVSTLSLGALTPAGTVGSAASELLSGNAADNQLVGQAGDDALYGGAGNDTLFGGPGADLLDGGAGRDRAVYADETGPISVDLAAGLAVTPSGTDHLVGIEEVVGADYGDTLRGDGADNLFDGRGGNDLIDGRGGMDIADYQGAVGAIVADLAAGRVTAPDGTDTLIGVEGVIGTRLADQLRGDAYNNYLGDTGGDDLIDGGGGIDTASWKDWGRWNPYQNGIAADLEQGTATVTDNGPAGKTTTVVETDTLVSIENLEGSSHADSLRGDAGDNRLSGLGGDDVLQGRGGADVMDGGDGQDTASFAGETVRVIADLQAGTARGDAITNSAGKGTTTYTRPTDTLVNIEHLVGSEGGDALYGNAGANRLEGGAGNDLLVGRGGNDTLDGGAGLDSTSFADATGPMTIDLARGIASGGGQTVTLTGIESVTGSSFGDTIAGSSANETLTGGAGFDGDQFLVTPYGGSDTIYFRDVWDHLVVSGFGPAYDTPDEVRMAAHEVGSMLRLSLLNPDGATHTDIDLPGMTTSSFTAADIWVR